MARGQMAPSQTPEPLWRCRRNRSQPTRRRSSGIGTKIWLPLPPPARPSTRSCPLLHTSPMAGRPPASPRLRCVRRHVRIFERRPIMTRLISSAVLSISTICVPTPPACRTTSPAHCCARVFLPVWGPFGVWGGVALGRRPWDRNLMARPWQRTSPGRPGGRAGRPRRRCLAFRQPPAPRQDGRF